MTARPPRAPTKGDGKRAKRAATHGERAGRGGGGGAAAEKRRQSSVVQTDPFMALPGDALEDSLDITLDDRLNGAPAEPEVRAAAVRALRVLVLEGSSHQARAEAAVAAAGHLVVSSAGRDSLDQLRALLGEVDAMLVGLPGGEPLIDMAKQLGPQRPISIAAWTANALEAARRAASWGADLVTVRPHDTERLAPILLAAVRLVEARVAVPAVPMPWVEVVPSEPTTGEMEPAQLVPLTEFQEISAGELLRAHRYGYPLSLAVFSVDVAPSSQPPPPGLRGILRARAGNALVQAVRDIDVATEPEPDRFCVLMPYTERAAGAEVARRIISAVAAVDPVVSGGRTFTPKVIGAVVAARPGEPRALAQLVGEVTQLLESAQVTGASLAVET